MISEFVILGESKSTFFNLSMDSDTMVGSKKRAFKIFDSLFRTLKVSRLGRGDLETLGIRDTFCNAGAP